MKVLGQAMLVFGSVAFLIGLGLYQAVIPSARTSLMMGGIIFCGVAVVVGTAITIRYALLKDLYPELLLQAHKHGAVVEERGVKYMAGDFGNIVSRPGMIYVKVILENATDQPREVAVRLSQLVRLSLKQTENISFPTTSNVNLTDGEVTMVNIPVMVAEKADLGRYMIEISITVRGCNDEHDSSLLHFLCFR